MTQHSRKVFSILMRKEIEINLLRSMMFTGVPVTYLSRQCFNKYFY